MFCVGFMVFCFVFEEVVMAHITVHPYLDRNICFGCSKDTDFMQVGRLVMCEKCFNQKLFECPDFWGKLL